MTARCLLIDPGMKTFLFRENLPAAPDSPQGCLSIASFLNQRGVETHILAVDALVEVPVEGEPWGLHRINPFIEEALAKCDLRAIGVAFNYTVLAEDVQTVSSNCRELAPKAYAFSDIHASYRMLEVTRRFAPQKADIDNNIKELKN